jgi:regulation of enolase protein 1 (concanavalin A-like superfamily)
VHVQQIALRAATSLVVAAAIITLGSPASAQTLTGGWTATDVGNPTLRGSASFNGSAFTISAAGRDVWGRSDQFAYTSRTMTGDVDVTVRVVALGGTHASAKAGVMIRASLAANAPYVYALVTPGRGVMLQSRSSTGANAVSGSAVRPVAAPVWLRLSRRGTRITGHYSTNGTSWSSLGTASLTLPATFYAGMAVTSHVESVRTTARMSGVAAVPADWHAADIGAPTPGNSWVSGTTWTSHAGGADIWASRDQFRYLYRTYTGDADIVVRVSSLQNVDPATKGGIMIRESLAMTARNVSLVSTPGYGVVFQHRTTAGGRTASIGGSRSTTPRWLKLAKRGNTITAFESANGSAWTMIGSQSVTLPSTYFVGLAATSHDPTAVAAVGAEHLSVGPPGTSAAQQPPTVSLTAPANASSFTAPASIAVSATASDPDGTVARVEFRAGTTVLGTDTTSPYTLTWSNAAAGSYTITAVATDNSGRSSTSAARTVTVSGPSSNQAPTVSLTTPVGGATFPAGASIALSAAASDRDGTITRVEFYRGSTLIGTDTSSPYAATWADAAEGAHSLMAVAYDNAGGMTSSAHRAITVTGEDVPSRAVFTPSADHSRTVDRYLLEVFAAGADPGTATPVASRDLGRPAVINGECSVDVSAFMQSLAPGQYIATVTAVSSEGSSRSAPSPAFTRP